MAKKRGIGGLGRLVFGLIGLALAALTIAIWLNYLVSPARAMVQGEKATVTVTRCDGSGLDSTCYARWSGGSGKLDGHAPPGRLRPGPGRPQLRSGALLRQPAPAGLPAEQLAVPVQRLAERVPTRLLARHRLGAK